MKIGADEAMRDIEPTKRNCYFSDEIETLKLHLNYSQYNCVFECLLMSAQEEMVSLNGSLTACTPWYFPFVSENHRKCNPWEAIDVINFMGNISYEKNCYSRCLPDCNKIFYKSKLTTEPLKDCDEKNVGVSPLCSFNKNATQPTLWSKETVWKNASSKSVRDNGSYWWRVDKMYMANMMTTIDKSYNAFEKDIAIVNVFFDTPTATEFRNQASMDWYTYLANVGGVLGLCIGLSIMTIFELIWLAGKILRVVTLHIVGKMSKFREQNN